MALNNVGLGFVFTAQDLASGTINKIKDSFDGLEGKSKASIDSFKASFAQFGTGLAVMGAGVAGLAGLNVATNAAGEFSSEIAQVATLIKGANVETATFEKTTMDLAAQFGGSAKDQAKGLYQTISAGITDTTEAQNVLTTANKLAVGGATDVTTAIDGLTNVMNTYGVKGAEATTAVSDAFFVAVRDGKTTAAELSSNFGSVGATAKDLNVSYTDLLAATAAITVKGINTASTMTGLKAAFANVIKPTSEAQAEAARLGITFDQTSLRSKGLKGFLDSVTTSSKFNSDSMSKLFGSVEALNVIQALTAEGGKKFNEVLGDMEGRTGSTDEAFKKMEQTLSFQESRFDALKNNALISIGKGLEPLKTALVKVANAILDAFNKIPQPIKDFGTKAIAVVSVALILVGGAIAASAALSLLGIAAEALGVSFGGLLLDMLPVVLVLAVLGIAIAGFIYAYKTNLGGFADFVDKIVGNIQLVLRTLGEYFETGGFSDALLTDLDKADPGVKNFALGVIMWVERIKNFFSGIGEGFAAGMEAVRPSIEAFKAALSKLADAFGFASEDSATASSKFDSFGATGQKVGNALSKVFDFIVKALTAVVEVAQGVADAWDYISAGAELVMNAFGGLKDKIVEVVGSFMSSDQATQSSGSAWHTLGEVIGFVVGVIEGVIGEMVAIISAAVGIVGEAIHLVIDIFQALGNMITGVVLIIAGLFTGDWKMLWDGMKLTAYGAITGIINIVLALVGAIAGAVDAIAGLFGKKTDFQKSIDEFRDMAKADLAKGMGVEGAAIGTSNTPAPVPAQKPTNDTAGPLASGSPAAAQNAAIMSSLGSLQSTMAKPQENNVTANLYVDSDKLYSSTIRAAQDVASRSGAPNQSLPGL